jgi:hypothetical protein
MILKNSQYAEAGCAINTSAQDCQRRYHSSNEAASGPLEGWLRPGWRAGVKGSCNEISILMVHDERNYLCALGTILSEDLKKLKHRLPLLDYLRQRNWSGRPAGPSGEFVGLCPLHPETRPSFYVNARKNLFYCHGCEQGERHWMFGMKSFREVPKHRASADVRSDRKRCCSDTALSPWTLRFVTPSSAAS